MGLEDLQSKTRRYFCPGPLSLPLALFPDLASHFLDLLQSPLALLTLMLFLRKESYGF